MLINCPKCGFSQPQDHYCASCGVDMDNFRPSEPPAWKKILSNPFLHVGFIFLLVFISILFIRKQQRDELMARVEYLKGGPVLVERQQVSANSQVSSESPEVDLEESTARTAQDFPAAAAGAPGSENLAVSSTTSPPVAGRALIAGAVSSPALNPPAQATPLKLIVTYAEIDTATLNAWLEEMRSAGQLRPFDNVMMGSLNQAAAKIKAAPRFKSLQKIERILTANNPNAEWFVGTHHGSDPESEMGLFSSLSVADTANGLFRGEIEVQRAFRDPKDPTKTMDRVSFGGPFEIPTGTAYLMSGLIPRQYVADLGEDQNPDAFLSLFKSQAFISRQTEFTLLIEFDTSGR